MVGDAEVLQAEVHRFIGHGFERVVAVGGGGVVVEGAAKLGEFDEPRQRVFGGGFDFAAVLAEFRRDEIEAERAVDIGFLVDLEVFRGFPGEAVFVEREALFEGQ